MWQECPDGNHCTGLLVSEEFVDKVAAVKNVSECLMMVKLVIGECLTNVIPGCVLQDG